MQEQGRQSPLQQLQLLMTSLRHDSIAVRHVALGEVASFLLTHKGFLSDTLSGVINIFDGLHYAKLRVGCVQLATWHSWESPAHTQRVDLSTHICLHTDHMA